MGQAEGGPGFSALSSIPIFYPVCYNKQDLLLYPYKARVKKKCIRLSYNIGLPFQLTVDGELLISSIDYLEIKGALRCYLGYKVGG